MKTRWQVWLSLGLLAVAGPGASASAQQWLTGGTAVIAKQASNQPNLEANKHPAGDVGLLVRPKAANPQSGAIVPQLLPRCGTVSLVSKSRTLSQVVMAEMLRKHGEFQNAGLTLTAPGEQADVQLIVADAVDDMPRTKVVAAVSDHDVQIRAVRSRDGMVAIGKVVALGSLEGIVAANAIDTLHRLCPAVITTSRWRRLGREPLDAPAIERLREAHSLSVVSHTSWMDDAVLSRALAGRDEMKAWHLAVYSQGRDADLRLEVSHDINNTITWRYEVFDRSGVSLWVTYVDALSEKHAIAKIVDSVTRQILRYRANPVGVRLVSSKVIGAPQGMWQAKLVTGDFRTTLDPLEISIDGEHFIARNVLGQTVFNIEAADIDDVGNYAERGPIFQLPFPESLINFVSHDPATSQEPVATIEASGLLVAYSGVAAVLASAAAVLAPIAPREHFFEIAWSEGDFFRQATFQVSGPDERPLMDAARGLLQAERVQTSMVQK